MANEERRRQAFQSMYNHLELFNLFDQMKEVHKESRKAAEEKLELLFGDATPLARLINEAAKDIGDLNTPQGGIPSYEETNPEFFGEWSLLWGLRYPVELLLRSQEGIDLLKNQIFAPQAGLKEIMVFDRVLIVILLYAYVYENMDSNPKPDIELLKKHAKVLLRCYSSIIPKLDILPARPGMKPIFRWNEDDSERAAKVGIIFTKLAGDLSGWIKESEQTT